MKVPEAVGLHRISQRDMPGDTFVEATLAENAEGRGQAAFEVLALLVLVVEFGWTREVLLFPLGEVLLHAGLERGLAGVDFGGSIGALADDAAVGGVWCHSVLLDANA